MLGASTASHHPSSLNQSTATPNAIVPKSSPSSSALGPSLMPLRSVQNLAYDRSDALHLLLRRQARETHTTPDVDGLVESAREDLGESRRVVDA